MQVIQIEISKLNHAEYNPRQITEKQMDKLVKSIEYYGFVEPVVVNKDFTIIGGHQRVKAYEILGNKTIPCTFVDLDKQNEKALNIALNKTGGEFDADMLQSLLSDLSQTGFDLELTGFENLTEEQFYDDDNNKSLAEMILNEQNISEAQDITEVLTERINDIITDIGKNDPARLAKAEAIIIPKKGKYPVIIIDENLSDLIKELERYQESGCKSPLSELLNNRYPFEENY